MLRSLVVSLRPSVLLPCRSPAHPFAASCRPCLSSFYFVARRMSSSSSASEGLLQCLNAPRLDRLELGAGEAVEYLTDVEGNLDYFRNWLCLSKLLCEVPPREMKAKGYSHFSLDFKAPGYFVFGGDVVDKGPADIRITRALVALKLQYPSRVFLILGNRDINKLRFALELAANVPGPLIPVAWDPSHTTYPAWLAANNLDDSPVGSQIDRVNVCKWMLACTMGSATTFGLRRTELQFLRGNGEGGEVSDWEVAESFMAAVDRRQERAEECYMLAFLALGQLALRAGSALWVHGGVNDWNCGLLASGASVEGVDEWVRILNDWKHLRVAEYVQYGIPPDDFTAYAVGLKPTVVYTSYLKNGNGAFPSEATVGFLARSGVNCVLAGHAPHGDCPLVMRDARLTVITADTSYSDASAPDSRGIAVSIVTVEQERLSVRGILASGKSHCFEILHHVPPPADAPFIGKQLPSEAWIKTYCPETKQFLAVRGEGYRLFPEWV